MRIMCRITMVFAMAFIVAWFMEPMQVVATATDITTDTDFNFVGLGPLIDGTNEPAEAVSTIQILFLMSIIGLAPTLLLLLTGFTRIIIALSFMRQAMGTQQMPPNQVLIGLALFLTLFLMTPVYREINENALQPFGRGEISFEMALENAMVPLREFMRNQTRPQDAQLFMDMAGVAYEIPLDAGEDYVFGMGLPDYVLIPAFIISELAWGFIIGFLIYIPFIVIDMVVASVLMAMGMMMLPPAMISLPFKILLFMLAGGWGRFIGFVIGTFFR